MNHPDANELLMTARHVLMSRVFPAVPEELHYEIRMIASAMGIAAREARKGGLVDGMERELLAGIVGERYADQRLADLRTTVAADIRQGRFDEPGVQRERLKAVLLETTLNALSVSNPKVLRQQREQQ